MKTIVIGDIHGRDIWKQVTSRDFDTMVFVGDYVDSFDVPGEDQLSNLRDIIEFKSKFPDKVALLIGNHDFHYFPEIGYTGTSGYQPKMKTAFEREFDTNRGLFKMSHVVDNILISHAGVTKSWLLDNNIISNDSQALSNEINQLFIDHPKSFDFYYGDSSGYGDHIRQSPIWVRPQSLYRDGVDTLQVVGHTGMKKIELLKGNRQGFYCIDVLGSSKEFLTIIDGKITAEKI